MEQWPETAAFGQTRGDGKMKTIQIFGSGCAKCERLTDAAEAAARDLKLDYRLEKITDVKRFADYGVMLTPAMALDGELKVAGRVPTHDEMKKMLQ
jgi:small redox-active disulfide protein 2